MKARETEPTRVASACGGGTERARWVQVAGGVVVFGLGLVVGGAAILAVTAAAAVVAPVGLVLLPGLLLGLRALLRRHPSPGVASGRLEALPGGRRSGPAAPRPETARAVTSRKAA